MSREKNLIKNFIVLSIGTYFPKLIAFIITPILTASLTKAEYGQYDLIPTVVSLLLPIVTLQISTAAFRFLIDRRDDAEWKSRIITNIYTFVAAVSVPVVVIYLLIARSFFGLQAMLVALYFWGDIFATVSQQVARGLGQNRVYSISTSVCSVVNLAFIAVLTGALFGKNYGLTGVLIAMVVSSYASILYIWLRLKLHRYIRPGYLSGKLIRELLAYSWPMVPNNISGWVLRLSDRLVITAVMGIEATAVYAVANKVASILTAAQNTFVFAWQENASMAMNDADREKYYSDTFNEMVSVLAGIFAAVLAMTPVIFEVLIRGDYSEAYAQVPVLYMSVMFSFLSTFMGGIYIAYKRTKNVGLSTIAAAAVNLIVDLAFVRMIGIWAASLSTVISYFVLFLYRLIDIQKFQKIRINRPKLAGCIGILTVMSYCCYRRTLPFELANAVIAAAVILIFDRALLKKLGKKVSARLGRK